MPVYPGDPVVVLKNKNLFEKQGYNTLSLTMSSHAGTHIDAPLHVIDKGMSIESIDLACVIGEAHFIEIPKNKGEKIYPHELQQFEIRQNDILIIRTGWEEKKYMSDYFFDFPQLTEQSADLLIEKKIKAIGSDSPSIDGISQKGIAHKKLLGAGIILIESLINLKQIIGSRLFFAAVPLKIKGADGSPVRAFAINYEI